MRPASARWSLILALAGCGDAGGDAGSESGAPTTGAPTTGAPTTGEATTDGPTPETPAVCESDGGPGGVLLWSRQGDEFPGAIQSITASPGGDAIVVGSRSGEPGDDYDVFVARFDPAGAPLWSDVYGGAMGLYDYPLDVAVDDAGFVHVLVREMISSVIAEGGGSSEIRLVVLRYAPDGAHVWRWQREPAALEDGPYDPKGRVRVVGDEIFVLEESIRRPSVIVRLDVAGNVLGEASFDPEPPLVDRRAFGPDGSMYVAGNTQGGNFSHPLWVGRYGPDGALVWSDTFGDSSYKALDLTIGADGEAYFLYVQNGDGGPTELRRYAADGELAWTEPLPTTAYASGLHCGGEPLLVGAEGPLMWAARYRGDGASAWTATLESGFAGVVAGAPNGDVLVGGTAAGDIPWFGRVRGG